MVLTLKQIIIKLLKENPNSFISGQFICDRLGVSRTAIWKCINQLKEDGYEIESISNKGYRLAASPDLLTFEEIHTYLTASFIGRNIVHFDSIGSTNTEAKKIADLPGSDGTIVIAEEQTNGRGRLGRSWISPKYKGVWMSIILKPDLNPMDAVKLTQIAAAAIVNAAGELNIKTLVKWPNDIVINHKKTCGILTEMNAELTRINYVVVGIGINVNTENNEFSEDIKEIATSLKVETEKHVNRQELVGRILNNFETLYEEFIKHSNIAASVNICRNNSAVIGKEIFILSKDKKIEVKAIDIDEDGRLLVEHNDGRQEYIISGEVSIRGKGSYI